MQEGERARTEGDDTAKPVSEARVRCTDHPDPGENRPPAGKSWAGIIANRGSGSGRGRRLVGQLLEELERLGIDSRVAWSPTERHDLVIASNHDASCCCLVAVGGDGTVGALLNEHPRIPIAILPAGTENLTAAHFDHRRDVRNLATAIAEGRSRAIDLGQADGQRFILMAGFGFDGDVVSRHHRGRLGTAGKVRPTNRAAYVEPILRSSFTYTFPAITVRIDDPGNEEILMGTTVFVFNLPRYALGLPFAPTARDDDGWLDLLVFRKPGPFHALYYLGRVLLGNHLNAAGVTYRRVRRVSLSADEAVPVQLDGDPAGVLGPSRVTFSGSQSEGSSIATVGDHHGSWRVEILPGEVRMLLPVRARRSTFRAVALARDEGSR